MTQLVETPTLHPPPDTDDQASATPPGPSLKPEVPLPLIVDAYDATHAQSVPPQELVYGILHRGSKMVLGGSSKTNKTWVLLDLALSVAYVEPWLGQKTAKGRVLFLNLEIQPFFFAKRIEAVASAKNINLTPGCLDVWNLRGHCASYEELLPKIRERIRETEYSLIVLDPIYKMLGGHDENAAGDVSELTNAIEALSTGTDAAVAFAAHFAKGNASAKQSIDRISGSGVFARDPDTILTMTKHETDGAFTVEPVLRNFPPMAPFVIRWDFPLMRRDDTLDPARLKQASTGRTAVYSPAMLLPALGQRTLGASAWQKAVCDETGMSRAKFYELKRQLVKTGQVEQNDRDQWRLKAVASLASPVSPE